MNRIEMIKTAVEKINKEEAFKKKMKKTSMKVKVTSSSSLARYEAEQKKIDKMLDKLNDNTHLYWNDASSFADKHYGDAYRETTKFDNEWN